LVSAFLAAPKPLDAQGIALSGVGPINRAMGGAATAAPIDAMGAIHWNPASISGLANSQVDFGMELLLPTETLSSSIAPGAFGPGFPPILLAGSDRGAPGVSPIPTVALVQKIADSPWTYGLGMFGIGGFRVNYPSSLTNPVLMPPPPNGLGLGRVFAEAEFLQIVPTASYALNDRLSIGFAPTLTLSKLAVNPLFLAAPDDANGDGFPSYPSGDGARYNWGAGFQVGVYYAADEAWQFGCSLKSPQWFEPVRFHTQDELGRPRLESLHFDYPMILSLGFAYSGIEDWLFACDVRHFDYSNTAGFGDAAGFDAGGRVTGLGWRSVVSVHTGVQYRAGRRLYLRAGYQYNDSPIGSDEAFFNVASPLIIQHVVSTGLSFHLTDNLLLSLAYLHGFENQASGPIQLPVFGAIPGTSVTSRVSADALDAGLTLRY
jgi:long-chain fatty acid transport protein